MNGRPPPPPPQRPHLQAESAPNQPRLPPPREVRPQTPVGPRLLGYYPPVGARPSFPVDARMTRPTGSGALPHSGVVPTAPAGMPVRPRPPVSLPSPSGMMPIRPRPPTGLPLPAGMMPSSLGAQPRPSPTPGFYEKPGVSAGF